MRVLKTASCDENKLNSMIAWRMLTSLSLFLRFVKRE